MTQGMQNVLAVVKKHGAKKRLWPDQQVELEAFVMDTPAIQNAKLFAAVMAMEGLLTKVVQAMPVFSVSEDLKKNIISISNGVLLSSHISAYKGKVALAHVMAMVFKHRYGLLPNIENNHADIEKIKSVATSPVLDKSKHLTIYQLTKSLVEDTKTPVMVALAAHVALMRHVYVADSTPSFWDSLNADLKDIQAAAFTTSLARKKPVTHCVTKIFKRILDEDRKAHGEATDTENLEENPPSADSFQDDIDAIITQQTQKATAPRQNNEEEEEEQIPDPPVQSSPSTNSVPT
ncbi:hypothetical protein C8J56DRAFT_901758 [Mycena floridula]|nr:hypothetical protein C8J56DRAFT_901758 [Mycena floridula]